MRPLLMRPLLMRPLLMRPLLMRPLLMRPLPMRPKMWCQTVLVVLLRALPSFCMNDLDRFRLPRLAI
jgi:hypothetical protein